MQKMEEIGVEVGVNIRYLDEKAEKIIFLNSIFIPI